MQKRGPSQELARIPVLKRRVYNITVHLVIASVGKVEQILRRPESLEIESFLRMIYFLQIRVRARLGADIEDG